MAKPQWTYPSNTNLGTITERIQHTIPILVFDNDNKVTVETRIFTNKVDSSKLPVYADDKFFWVKSNGLPQTPWFGEPASYSNYLPTTKDRVFKIPRDQFTINGERTSVIPRLQRGIPVVGFFGVAADGVPFKTVNSRNQVFLNGKNYTENSYIHPAQEPIDTVNYVIGPNRYPSQHFVDGSGVIESDKSFYYHSDPRLLYTKDPSHHSPIVGYAFDGNPIYGPYGFSSNYKEEWNGVYVRTPTVYIEEIDSWIDCTIISQGNDTYYVSYNDPIKFIPVRKNVPLDDVKNGDTFNNNNLRYSYSVGDIVRVTNPISRNVTYYKLISELSPYPYDPGHPLRLVPKSSPVNNVHWREALPTEVFAVMRTSYRITEVQRTNGTLPDGTYLEDFVYEKGLGDLDKHNGKWCNETPEYPGGTYAYFITVDPDDVNLPRYPYIIGPTYYQEPLLPNGDFSFPGDISLEVISGNIPRGMRIEGLSITGVPFEVSTLKRYRFVLRASNPTGFSDRTYSITVDGPDVPIWETPAGDLEVGKSGRRSLLNVKLLKRETTIGASYLYLSSVRNLQVDSIVTCDMFPNAFLPDTKITKIDTVNRAIFLSKPIQEVIPTLFYPLSPQFKYTINSVNQSFGQQNFLNVDSIHGLLIGDIIKESSNTYLSPGTIIEAINYENKVLRLSKPLLQTVPQNIKFSVSHPDNTEIKCTHIFQHTNLFVLDNQYVNYQLSAVDSDTAAGVVLKYYIPPNGGMLPLGLSLSEDGVISGFTAALLANEQQEGNGNYDMQLYDKFVYDYGVKPYNGFDSFLYDTTIYDYWTNVVTPRKVNRYYEFIVRVTDGVIYSDRKFRIFVVGDDYFRADTTILRVGNGIYTTDVSAIRAPYWLSPSYLGKRRANNYITTILEVFKSPTLAGTLGFILDPVNDDGSPSILPPGMRLDQITGSIYGDVPYQPAVTKTYKFTVRAINYDPNNVNYSQPKITASEAVAGQYIIHLDNVADLQVNSLVTQPAGTSYITPGSVITAVDTEYHTVTLNTPILKNIPSGIRLVFSYLASTAKTFTMDVLGEVDSTITFKTPGDLGTIAANYISNLSIVATTKVKDAVLTYTLIGGKLPAGLTLVNDGTIQGKVQQFSNETYRSIWKANRSYVPGDIIRYNDLYYKALYASQGTVFNLSDWALHTPKPDGLTSLDQNKVIFDKFTTSIDREYKFIVLAQDQFELSATTKIFDLKITTPNNLLYSNIYVKPFLSVEKRQELSNFFSNPDIFTLNMIYRSSDPEFGIQSQLKMLLYSGIETKAAGEYAASLNRSSRKRYKFGKVKKASAKTPGTNDVIYEVVYVEMIDDLENEKGSVSSEIITRYLNSKTRIEQTAKGRTSRGEYTIPLYSVDDLRVGYPIINSSGYNLVSKDTIITSIIKDPDKLGITISKPLIADIPNGTPIVCYSGGITVNQSKRDAWDRHPADDPYEDFLSASQDALPPIWMQDKILTVDQGGQKISDSNKSSVFGNSTTNIRSNISNIGDTERNYLPLWMRTPQTFSGVAQGFTKAVVLCYVMPGYADTIINNIKNLGIDFKNIDFTIDRVIIDSVKDEVGDKYIAFGAREIING